ncbi:Probable protein kinase UbiB (Ubiquinone biosynthesis protein UbiB) [Durusdinium trenchii]|uniref:Probable protein kinase UbiB (Ubiquinone biosynthesis protein UbiB) n=1 Tax=Durusdinium trenchii TaxID=1381693 RepID=A0ABP0I592_9DINO
MANSQRRNSIEPYPLRFLRNLARSREIATVFLNHGFGDLIERLGLRRYLQWGRRLISRKTREVPPELTTAARIRLALQDLGPTFVKFGQVLSTRPDLIPVELVEELEKLQEDVPPFEGETARTLIEQELGRPVSELFARFDDEPMAAGSLAQVHRAVRPDGAEIVLKVRRPNVIRELERDLSLMAEVAELLERHILEIRVFDPVGLVNHFTRTIRREVNFQREARSMDEMRKLFQDDDRLYVPEVFHDMSTEALLAMEYIDGYRLDDPDEVCAAGLDPHVIAIRGANIFMRQAFEFGFFHGDPHPGNMRLRPDGRIALLDYGMMGYLASDKREQLVDLFLAIVRNNVDRATAVVLEMGNPAQSVETVMLRADIQDFIETYYGVQLEQLRIGPLLSDFVNILASHGLRCPADLMLLIRAIVTLEGVGRKLDPEFNLAAELAPFIERVVRQRYDPKRIAERAIADIRELYNATHDLPLHLGKTLQKLSEDDLRIHLEHQGLDKLITEFDRSSNRIVIGMITSAILLASAMVIRVTAGGSLWITVPAFVLSSLLGVWLIIGILRSGRL